MALAEHTLVRMYMYVCAKGCLCVCIRVNKDVVLNANNICTASAKSKKTNEKKGDEAELNTKWTICKVWLCKRERVLVVRLQGARWVVGAGWWVLVESMCH